MLPSQGSQQMRQGPLLKPIALTFSAIRLVRVEISRAGYTLAS